MIRIPCGVILSSMIFIEEPHISCRAIKSYALGGAEVEGLGGGVILALADSSPRRRSGLLLPFPRPKVPTMSRPILLARWFWFVQVALALVTNAWGSRYVFSANSLMEVGPAAGGRGELRIPVEAVVGEPRYGAGGGLDCFWRFASPMTVDVCELVAPIRKRNPETRFYFSLELVLLLVLAIFFFGQQ